MSAFAKPVEKVLKSFLATVLAISFCPLIPTGKAQAQEAGDSGELAAPAQVAGEGGIEAADPDDENLELTVEDDSGDDGGVALQADDSGTPIADWTISGTCCWMIDARGCLTIEPLPGTSSGDLPDFNWSPYDDDITSVVVKKGVRITKEGFTSRPGVVADASFMFSRCRNLVSADLSGLDVSKVKDMSHMFEGCTSLASVDLSGFDNSNAVNMSYMFEGCSSLTSLDASSLGTAGG